MRSAFLFISVLTLSAEIFAGDNDSSSILVDSFRHAMAIDPRYRAAEAEFDAQMIESRVAGTAYYPQLNFSTQQTEFDEQEETLFPQTKQLH